MADEFAKGLAILTSAGLGWMVISGWYFTGGFESAQLIGPGPTNPGFYDSMAIVLRDVLFWFAILGALTFWGVIPAINQARTALDERSD